jgi:tRNA/tmRNA/rRNA uracil-C5-methylase (TrmA/RlmC/RlmD family)
MARPLAWLDTAAWGLRDRLDFVIAGSRFGMYDVFRSEIIDLPGCPQLSPRLESWLTDFRRLRPAVQKGSVRLRTSPSGLRGVWYDFANQDIRDLLQERTHLVSLLEAGVIVEMGQRRKRVVHLEDSVRLADPADEPWFETYTRAGDPIELGSAIASFTQPSLAANAALLRWFHLTLDRLIGESTSRMVEFGSGTGNLTLAALSRPGLTVTSLEIDRPATQSLEENAKRAGLHSRLTIEVGNFHRPERRPDFRGSDLLLVDPPRSGLGDFIPKPEDVASESLPKSLIYISCFPDSWASDSARWSKLGYSLDEITLLDQFPQSSHVEVLSVLRRSGLPAR